MSGFTPNGLDTVAAAQYLTIADAVATYETAADAANTYASLNASSSVVNVKGPAYGAKGDGSTDDTAAINAAIAAAGNTGIVYFPAGTYSTTGGHVLGNYTCVLGYGATLALRSGTSPLLTCPAQGALETAQRSVVAGLTLDGVATATGSVGLKVLNHAALVVRDVRATRCETGFSILAGQFASFYSPKAYACTVGFYMESTAADGGANSNSFYDLQAIGNSVGVVLNAAGAFPMGAVYLRNPSILGNTVCGLAAFGVTSNFVVDGGAPEANGTGAATLSYKGLTIKKAYLYLSNSKAALVRSYIGEATITPIALLESGSRLDLTDIDGYGNPSGTLASCDTTSGVTVTGQHGALGVIEGVLTAAGAAFTGTQTALLSPPGTWPADIPNSATQPQRAAPADVVAPATDNGEAEDTDWGEYHSVTFGASAGSQDANRIMWFLTNAGTCAAVALLLKADVDTRLMFGPYAGPCLQRFTLRAGRWTRLLWLGTGLGTGLTSYILNADDAAGANIRMARLHHLSGTDSIGLRQQIAGLFAGAYNPKISALKPEFSATAAPTAGTWAVGDTVWHSAPASGGNIGWVCTTAGTPGTWKAFGTIA